MRLRNSSERYGTVARFLHWSLALLLIGLFALGWWMTEMSYYDPWYRRAYDLHKAVGMVVFALVVLRVVWAVANQRPRWPATMSEWQRRAAAVGHHALYVLMLLIPISGYLISTADGRGIDLFGLFEVPAVLPAADGREETAGIVHYYLAFGTAWLVLLHTLIAFKHQFVDRDGTMRKMIG